MLGVSRRRLRRALDRLQR
ncbi:MAG: hypothetical protein L0G27_02155, partial [Paracoccus sp. (in: a-proteobacteria)]|nr:hypothetical protein [Paracoccus sp. (in: a-proteobacteria)]